MPLAKQIVCTCAGVCACSNSNASSSCHITIFPSWAVLFVLNLRRLSSPEMVKAHPLSPFQVYKVLLFTSGSLIHLEFVRGRKQESHLPLPPIGKLMSEHHALQSPSFLPIQNAIFITRQVTGKCWGHSRPGTGNLFYKKPNSIYFRFCRQCSLRHRDWTVPSEGESSHEQNAWAGQLSCSNVIISEAMPHLNTCYNFLICLDDLIEKVPPLFTFRIIKIIPET